MVFESVVTDVLNKILGDYVENLDKKQLKIGIWGGDVVLHNLKLRENALDDLDLPVQLVYGYLGELVLKIPWKNLYSQPVVAQIQDFYILIAPKGSVAYDAEKEAKYELQTKQTALQAIDDAHKRELDKDRPKPDATFTEKLTAQIVNNLQVKIANVHVRYEDTTSTGKPFAFGISLHNLEIYTTDPNWVKCYLTEQVSRVYKIANLDSMSAYMNCNADLYSNLDKDKLTEMFRSNIARKEMIPKRYSYVLGPISSIAKLQLNMMPEYDDPPFKIPKIDLCLEMEKLNIGLTSTQFQDILKLADNMNRLQLGAPYRQYRPFNTPYKGHYKEWWQFAITAVLEENIRKRNRSWAWDNIQEHRNLCRTYAEKFKEKELSKKPPANLVETCTLCEQKLDLFNLILIRKRVQLDIDKIRKEQEDKKTTQKGGWFSGWFGGGGGAKEETDEQGANFAQKFEAAMTQDEKDKLYQAIGYQENTAPIDLPEEYEAINMNFKLIALEIGLYDDSKEVEMGDSRVSYDYDALQTVLQLKFSMATCSLQQRPAAGAISLTAGMKEMKVTGLQDRSNPDKKPATIIESKVTDEFNLLDIFFETNPLDKKCDQRVRILARPLQIVYDSDTILYAMKVFSPPKTVNLSEFEGAAQLRMANFKERSATGMAYMIEKHSMIEVDIKLMPNIFIVPHSGSYNEGKCSMVVVTLGQVHVTSRPHKGENVAALFEAGAEHKEILQNIMGKAYDNYEVSIADMQVMVVKPGEQWENALVSAAQTEMHVLRPISLTVSAELCVVDDDPRLPKTKVNILLPGIDVNITEDRIFEALNVLTSLPLPEGETPETPVLKKVASSASSLLSVTAFLSAQDKRRRPSKTEMPLETEIIQYTSLEVNFALKEINVTLSKSCTTAISPDSPLTDSAKFITPTEDMPSSSLNGNEEFLDVTSGQVSVLAPEPVTVQKILRLQILQLEAHMAQRTYEMVATAKLGAINLTQFDYFDGTEKELYVIDTPRFSADLEYLLTVSYTNAQKTAPEFITKYNSTEQMIAVNFSTLNLTLHQECLQHLLAVADSLQRKLEAATKKADGQPKDRMASAADDGIISKLATIVEEDDTPEDEEGGNIVAATATQSASTPAGRNKRHHKVVECIKIHLVANLQQVGMTLTCRKRPLATFDVKHFTAGVILKSSYTELNLQLKDILVTDLNPKSIHTSILSIVGSDVLNCQVVLFNKDETADYNSDDMKVKVEIGCMKIVFLNWFVTSVLSFLNNFQAAQQAIAQASAAAADAAKQNALDAYQKATRMKLDIKVKAPIIVVPVDSQSQDGIALDLGFLKLSNITSEINVPNTEYSPAVVDEMKLEFRDMKLSKVNIINDDINKSGVSFTGSSDTVDLAYGLKSSINIFDPISMILNVKRNLSSAWYHDVPEMDVSGRLKSIEFNLFKEDYALLMSILNRNLSEGANEFPPIETDTTTSAQQQQQQQRRESVQRRNSESPTQKSPRVSSGVSSAGQRPDAASSTAPTKIYEQLKFNFQFDGIIANFLLGANEGLARFGLYFVSVKGTKLIDGTLSTSIVLCNLQLDDTRSNTNSKITNYLCRKDWKLKPESAPDPNNPSNIIDHCYQERNFMLDITAIIKENDTFAEVRVCGFDLILCVDFLLQLTAFISLPEDQSPVQSGNAVEPATTGAQAIKQSPQQAAAPSSASPKTDAQVVPNKKMNLLLHIEEPDIILIESLEDINAKAIIFNMQANLAYSEKEGRQTIQGQIDAMKMYMCSFMPERREATRHYIIHPCVISLQGSTPENEGLHISLNLSEIIINISPATIELFNKALQTISVSSTQQEALEKVKASYNDIWKPKKFKEKDFWFLKVEQAQEAFELLENPEAADTVLVEEKGKTERCIIEVPSIMLVIESGIGYYTIPLLSIDTRLTAVVADWSRDLSVKGSLSLNMNYYNQALAVWEPIIEMNERLTLANEKEYLPWQLMFSLDIEKRKSEFDDDVEEKTTKIKIHSDENLEMTLSKTCLEIIGTATEAFSQAIDAKGLIKPEVIAPYVIENDTGFDISINFRRGVFTLHECHMPKATSSANSLNHSLVFQAGDTNVTSDQVKDCTISAGGRAYLQTRDLSTITCEEDEEYNIYVKIGEIDKELVLPVAKSDKRYFSLFRGQNQDPWGIVSEVRSEFGTTKVNIHGVVNIHNHFTATIQVHSVTPHGNAMTLIGEIPPGEVYHVPLHAIYADNKNLFFTLNGYRVSVQGIKWNDCPTDLNYTRQLQCDPVETYEPLYITAIRLKTEIYYENTNKFKILSAYYTIHLKPPLYLRNALPISIVVSVAGCSVHQNGGEAIESKDQATNEASMRDECDNSKSMVKEDILDYGEKEVNPGHVLHLPTVKLSNVRKESKSYLVVRLVQYLEKDWSCTTEISEEENNKIQFWKFRSYDSAAAMDMNLCVFFENREGSLQLTLFSPFWMINKTGLMLSYKTDAENVDVLYHPPEYDGPILFSFRDKFFFDKKRATIRVDNGEWSDKIPLDVAGAMGEVTCKANDQSYQIGVHNHLTHNSLTKQITFIPFYVAMNKCDHLIELQEQTRPGDPWMKIEPNSCQPLWPKNDSDNMVIARVNNQRTAAFKYSEAQCILLRLEDNECGGINVDVQATEGGVYIIFTEYNPGDAPGLLINHTHATIEYHEKCKDRTENFVLNAGHKVLHTWCDPNGSKTLVFGKNKVESDLRRDGVGELILPDDTKAYWVSFLDGLQRVVLFTEVEQIASKSESSTDLQAITQAIEVRIHGIGLSVLNNDSGLDIMYLGITSSGIIWESKKAGKKRFKTMKIHDTAQVEAQYQQYLIDKGVKMSGNYYLDNKHELNFNEMTLMKNNSKRSLQRTFYPGVWMQMNTSPYQTQIHAKINKIQLDNQLSDCIFPVVLAPIPPPKSVATTTTLKPFVECSIVQRMVPNSTVKQYKYASMLIQEFHFKVDLPFLTAIAEMFAGTVSDEQAAKLFNEDVCSIEKPLSDLVETHSMQEQKNFYDNLHLGPLKIHVSFSMAGSDISALPGILSTLVQGVGVTLTDVNDVVFRLAFFEREYQFFTQRQLTSEIVTHYTGQALKQLYVLVLGLDVLGNPYGLVVGLKKGVEDLFYEPFQGAIQGPGEFAEGLVLGVKSLFGHTVGGAAGAVSKITGAMGKGLAALTFDDDYQKKRRQAMQKKPATFQEGIARSGKGLVMGFVDGVTGVVTKPVSGAREEGVEGFFKGLGKGAIGLVARPTAGVVDFASGSFDAVKRAAESHEDITRLRPPRFVHQDNVLRPYCRAEAEGNKLLKEIEKGKYATTDCYIHSEEVVDKKEIILISNHRVIYLTKNDLFGSWNVQWTYLWHEISSIASTDRGVELKLKKEGKKVLGLFSSNEGQRKVILMPHKTKRDKLAEIMESQRKEN